MNLIGRQSIKSTTYIYTGVILGFITSTLLFPKFLTTEQIGVLSLLVSYSMIISQIGTLGFKGTLVKYFPKKKDLKRIISLILIFSLLGSIVIFIVYYAVFNHILPPQQNTLFDIYYKYIFPLSVFNLLFIYLETYNNILGNASTGILIREFIQRLFILGAFIFFMFHIIDFEWFVNYYVILICFSTVLIFLFLIWKGNIDFKSISFKNVIVNWEMLIFSMFSFLNGFSSFAATRIDLLMLNEFLDTSNVGIYTTMMYFGLLVSIPTRGIVKLFSPLIAEAFSSNNMRKLNVMYKKNCYNQFLFAALLLLLLCINLDNVFRILPGEYGSGKYVLLILALMHFLKMSSGLSTQIIGFSKFYKYSTYFMILYLVLIVITNLIFIPVLGMNGAAIATCLATLIYVLIKYYFIYVKFGLQPYNFKYILVLAISGAIYFLISIIPSLPLIVDILVRSLIASIVLLSVIYILNLSEEVKGYVDKILLRWFNKNN